MAGKYSRTSTGLVRKPLYLRPDVLAALENERATLAPRRDGQFGIGSLVQEILCQRYRLTATETSRRGRRRHS